MIGDPAFKLPWYQWWVSEQMRKLPAHVLLGLPGGDSDGASAAVILKIWSEIWRAVLVPEPRSINSIADMLTSRGFVYTKDSYKTVLSIKGLVFAPWESNTRSLLDFILGFGVMLLTPNYCAYENEDARLLFDQTKIIRPSDISAHVLNKLCGVKFEWVDSLSCHLELDKHSGTLYIYRYPSFCVSRLQEPNSRGARAGGRRSVLHACASEKNRPLPWVCDEDIDGLLQEILLSYRVVFGQSKRSRAVFRKLQPFASIPMEEYDLAIHFPHLRSRIAQPNGYASRKKPRSLRRLWQDRRDSPA
ncbi:hypothetical protein F5B22DRAFT_638016 [Xylaria bambusicola]|uniref:uncharacterized protein n=1 Tax=Xylaria bambusicola TaxID=326684 RepID=UPI002007C562|nr:uncharacterized protein F5B22DRAFT_638016 [Xylaria bambusicola]KAI0509557.1 hypothetical protein F5B22DRAFT_638016 [Xylaria bambusicola]